MNQTIMKEMDVLISQLKERESYINEQVSTLAIQEIGELSEISMTELHVLAYIGNDCDVNGMKLSKKMGMTRGGVSKVVAGLQKKALIEAYNAPNNKKKVYYRLTPLGERVNQIHNEKHQQRDAVLEGYLNQFSDEEKAVILKFIEALQLFAQSR